MSYFSSNPRGMLVTVCVWIGLSLCSPLAADTFGTGDDQFEIDFVTIGNPGNVANMPPHSGPVFPGSVPYVYRLAKFEISEEMIQKANAATSGTVVPLNITIDSRGPNKPATSVSWFEAARYVNWLNTSSGFSPAYKFVQTSTFVLWEPSDLGFDANNRYRNTEAHYFLPSFNEWYKAAYFDASQNSYFLFPSGKNSPPIAVASGSEFNTAVYKQPSNAGPADSILAGGPSPFGTVGQGGNVTEWHETEFDDDNNSPSSPKILRGGTWESTWSAMSFNTSSMLDPSFGNSSLGFRIASVPEPVGLIGLLVVVCACAMRCGRWNQG